MPEEAKPEIKEAENTVRDLKNWIFTFAKEYNLPENALKKLHEEVDKVAEEIGQIACKPDAQIKEAEDKVRDLKNFIATYAEEFNLADEAKNMLNTKIEELAKKIGETTCK